MSEPSEGHNSRVAADELKQFVERLEHVEEEIKGLNDDKRDIYGEVKGRGFDKKVISHILKLRRQNRDDRLEYEAILDLYMTALGMT